MYGTHRGFIYNGSHIITRAATCGLCDRDRETSFHIYAKCSETVHFRSREQKTPGGILRWFSERFYIMHLCNNNKLIYEELKTPSDPRGRAG